MVERDPLSAQRVPAGYLRHLDLFYAFPEHVPWPAGALGCLSEREQVVVTRRLDLDGAGRQTQVEIGRRLGVTASRVAQIEARAFRRLTGGPLAEWERFLRPHWRVATRPRRTPAEHPWWLLP